MANVDPHLVTTSSGNLSSSTFIVLHNWASRSAAWLDVEYRVTNASQRRCLHSRPIEEDTRSTLQSVIAVVDVQAKRPFLENTTHLPCREFAVSRARHYTPCQIVVRDHAPAKLMPDSPHSLRAAVRARRSFQFLS